MDLVDKIRELGYAKYSYFSISGPEDLHRLSVNGYSGNAGKILFYEYCRVFMVSYFCHDLSDNYVDLSDLYVVISDIYVETSLSDRSTSLLDKVT